MQQYGVTAPISTDPPKPADVQASQALLSDLKALNQFESDKERKIREQLLGHISRLVKEFVREVSLKKGMSNEMAIAAGGKIYTSGSYRLGVHGPGSDIDTVCVCPKHVYHEDFFETFYNNLRAWSEVTELSAVPNAFVPIMKAVISGVEVDFLFARVNLTTVPDDLTLEDDNILRGVDEPCQRSLNGPRVTDLILNLVPNVDVFRLSLRTIRLWAKKRGIYSNVLGFLGGVAWALLVARICQLYPTAPAAAIVGKFFPIFYQWSWPQPVILKKIENGPPNMQHPVWNPRIDRRDQAHRMPVITPAYPSMCSTHNVTASTMSIMRAEMLRAMSIVDRIMVNPGSSWNELFEKHEFFTSYRTYVQVIASASSAELLKDWSGTVESKLRTLIMELEQVETVLLAHPFCGGKEMTFLCLTEEEQASASQGDLTDDVMQRTEDDCGKEEIKRIYTKSFFVGLDIEKQKKDGNARVLNLSWASRKFCQAAQAWDKYDEMEMSVMLRACKRASLPFYVFDDGQRPKSKKDLKRQKSLNKVEGEDAEDGPNKRAKQSPKTEPVKVEQSETLAPPPAVESQPAPTAEAMASFASAAKGVTTADEKIPGMVILNGGSA